MTVSPDLGEKPEPPAMWRFLSLALAVPILLGLVAIWMEREYAVTEDLRLQAEQSYNRSLEASALIGRIADAETSQRGFVITGVPDFLSDYRPARAQAVRTFEKLEKDFAHEPHQLRLHGRLRALAMQKFAEMDAVIAKRRAEGPGPAAARVIEGRGKRLMDAMRAVSAEMVQENERGRQARVEAYRQRIGMARVVLWIGIGFTGLLLVIAAVVLWRQSEARYRARVAAYGAAERNRSILDSTIDAIAILNPSGTIETINASASRLLGYSAKELTRRDVSVLIDLQDRAVTFHERVGLVDGKLANPYLPDRKIKHRDGHDIPVDIALGVMPQPDGMHIVASVRDISDRKRVERLKDELMSTVSHELRTPLTSVVGALGLLRAGSAGKVPAAAARLIEIAENNSRRLIRLINDMLDIDRIQSGRLHLDRQPIDLRAVVAMAGEGSSGLAEAAGVRVETRMPDQAVTVAGDADRLLQVITNLVSNAIRVSPSGSAVTICLDHDGDGGKAQVSIDDEGPGVPAEFRDRIFGRFERAQGEQSSGTGLGLAISREIIGRHDGRIWFEDREDGGTRFAFTLDLLRAKPDGDHVAGPRILIVEDDDDMAETLRQMVVAIGYRAHCVSTSSDARGAIASGDYAALLLDLKLPDESGLALAHDLRTRNGHSSLPIIVVSALTRDGVTEPVPLDIVDWIEKPVDPERLTQAVREAIKRSGSTRPTVLHLDDDQDMLDIVASVLSKDARVLKATDLATARALLETESPDCAILDLHLAEGDSGLDLLPMLTDANGLAVPTIIFSAHDVGVAAASQVDAVLVKSRGSLPDLRATVERVLDDRAEGKNDG